MALQAAGQAVPQPIRIRALLDTGASCTCVDPSVLAALNLTPTGSATMITPSTGATPHQTDQFDVGLIIPGASGNQTPLVVDNIAVVASQLTNQGFQALIGRDLLKRCVLTYNGAMNLFTLAY